MTLQCSGEKCEHCPAAHSRGGVLAVGEEGKRRGAVAGLRGGVVGERRRAGAFSSLPSPQRWLFSTAHAFLHCWLPECLPCRPAAGKQSPIRWVYWAACDASHCCAVVCVCMRGKTQGKEVVWLGGRRPTGETVVINGPSAQPLSDTAGTDHRDFDRKTTTNHTPFGYFGPHSRVLLLLEAPSASCLQREPTARR